MKKITMRTAILWGMVFSFLILPIAVSAQEGGNFSETFDDATLEGWEHTQDVRVVDGVLRIDPENYAFRLGIWAEPEMAVRVHFSPPGGILIHYHSTDQGFYRVVLLNEGLHTEIALEKHTQGTFTPLQVVAMVDFVEGEWQAVEILFREGQHLIYLNGEEVIRAADESPLPPGGIGFAGFGENVVEVDDLVVEVPGGALQPVEQAPLPEAEVLERPEEEERLLPPAYAQMTPTAVSQQETGTRGLLEELFVSGANPIDLQTFGVNLGLAALLAFILGRVYIHWGASLSNRRKFAANFMLITVTTTFIILVVRSSVALSLGLVGALSIVRFRAAIKEPEELAYLFLAIGLGIGLGDNQRLITILAFTAAILVLGLMNLFRRARSDVNMHLNIAAVQTGSLSLESVMKALEPHCARIKLLRYDENEKGMELSFLVELRELTDLSKAYSALQALSPQVNITFLDNKGIW